jgi:hypothetical protein
MSTQTNKSVLLIGLIPELVDFSGMPGMNAEKIHAGIIAEQKKIADAGFEPHQLLIDMGETAESVIRAKLAERAFGVVVFGAGLRVPPPHLGIFEKVINVVHANAPQAKLAFNTNPADSLDAIRRWSGPPAA